MGKDHKALAKRGLLSRRKLLIGGAVVAALAGFSFMFRRRIRAKLSQWTRRKEFAATPPLVPHDPVSDRRTIYVAQGGTPAANIDSVLAKLGGIATVVGRDDVVIIKVSAQWWNQGMTNVAAVKRTIEHILAIDGFAGEVIVFENTHFRMADGSGLSRAWVAPSQRNVDVDGWDKLGDLIPHFASAGAPVSFVGLVDGGGSELSGDTWWDPGHQWGVYGGDGRGPIAPGEDRDGYHWDFDQVFSLERSLVDSARTPLTWPVFTSPHSGLVVNLKDGLFERVDGKLRAVDRKLVWVNMTTANEHGATGFTGAVKSTMGVVNMSCGRLGTHPRASGYDSTHYFGYPDAKWRMAGPLSHFARHVRKPNLYLTVAEWVGAMPPGRQLEVDTRLSEEAAFHTRTVVAGTNPVAIDTWCVANLIGPLEGRNRSWNDLGDERSLIVKFLRYYRQASGSGTLDLGLIDVV